MEAAWVKRVRDCTYWLVVMGALFAFWRGASVHAVTVNHTTGKDQGAYLALAGRIARSHRVEVDGARPPLYPALLTLAWRAGDARQTFFLRARTLTIVLATLAWLAFLLVLRARLRPLTALAVWLAIGFSVWIFYAPYVKAESLFFPCASASFLLLFEQIRRPRYRAGCVAGFVSGLAHLLKASLAPALWLFVAVQALLVARTLVASRSLHVPQARRRIGSTLLLVATFFVVLLPYLAGNARVFGRPFYNVNSDFYVWNDSWADTGRSTRGKGDRWGFPQVPPSKLPSAQRYFRRHRAADVLARLERGAVELADQAAHGPGFLQITSFALLLGLGAVAFRRRLCRRLRVGWPLALYSVAYFAAYLVLDCWFHAINPGLRFVAALFGPALFLAGFLADRARFGGVRRAWVFPASLVVTLLLAAPRIVTLLRTWGGAGW
jgi:hypothetical protein